VPLNINRARFYVIQNALYTSNRRDCWAYVQGSAPLEVKRVIWEHESDELINDPRAGMDHYSLTVKQGEVIGLNPEDFERAEIPPMVRSCFYAWHHIALRGHWLTAYTASHMLERRNNGKIVKGGGMSFRVGKKFENELGINLKKMISSMCTWLPTLSIRRIFRKCSSAMSRFPRIVSWFCKERAIQWLSIALIVARWAITWSGSLE
jgi:TENA/THI-4/PQQC family